MDIRSFSLNFEVNAFIYEPETVQRLEADFYNDLKECTEITREWYNSRGKLFRFKEAISRLISPMI
ncbi:Cardiolipin synthase [bioreactor metagenome]|uniref:Cardiolipin synthase n=1 Tax=bioreactor metagenome TaxID=1076179 RepID=A0A645GMX9_9ZZZZ